MFSNLLSDADFTKHRKLESMLHRNRLADLVGPG
jgi:hypothetical protein